MKKIFIFLCTLIISFTGCTKNNIESETLSNSNNLQHEKPSIEFEDSLKSSNMINPEYYIYDTSDIYYLKENADMSYSIMYIDSNNMSCSYLCTQINCTHNDDTCSSYVQPFDGCSYLSKLDNNLILLTRGNNDTIPPSIRIMSLSGNNPKQISKFKMNQNILMPYVLGENTIYFTIRTTQEKDNGSIEIVHNLIGVNIETGYEKNLLTMSSFQNLIGAIDNKFVMSEADNQFRAISIFDPLNKTIVPIFNYNSGEGIVFINSEKLYYISYSDNTIYTISIDGKIDKHLSLPFSGSISTSFLRHNTNDAIIMDNFSFINNDWVTTKYYIDLNSKEIKSNAFMIEKDGKNTPFMIYAVQDNSIIGIIDYKYEEKVEFLKDGSSFSYLVSTPIFAKFSFNDFFNNTMVYSVFDNI